MESPDLDGGNPDEEAHRQFMVKLEETCRGIGLYMNQALLQAAPELEGDDGPTKLVLLVDFTIGDRAFAAPVQEPEQARFDEMFREMAMDDEEAEYEDLRRRWQAGELGWQPKPKDNG